MASQLSSGDLISERYASALYDLAAEKKIVDSVLKDLELLQKCIQESEDLKLLVKSPLITSSDKLNVFERILSKQKEDNLTKTFLKVTSSNKRFAKLSSIISQFMNINSQKRGNVLADVTSADELSDKQKNENCCRICARGKSEKALIFLAALQHRVADEVGHVALLQPLDHAGVRAYQPWHGISADHSTSSEHGFAETVEIQAFT